MSVHPYREEELNHFKCLSLVLNEFPRALRQTFKTMWDTTIGRRPGSQLWDDSTAVRNLFVSEEGGTTKVPAHQSYDEWDCTDLFQATIFAKSFSIHSKTLNEVYVKPYAVRYGSFHRFVLSPVGDNMETIALAIDQLRRLRNTVCHSSRLEMDKATFDQNIQYAKEAFKALGISTASIDAIESLTSSEFPTKRVRMLERQLREDNQAYMKCLESRNADMEEIKDLLTAIKQNVESNKQEVAVSVRSVVEDDTSPLEDLRMRLEEDMKVLLKEIYELKIKVEERDAEEEKTETPSLVNRGDSFTDITVPPLVAPGQTTYDTEILGGHAAVGDRSAVNVGTGSQSVTPQVAPGNAAIRNESDGTRSQSVTPQVAPGNAAIRNESDGTRSQSVPPQVAPGQRTYKTQISGGTVAIGDHSVVNVDTRSQSVTPQVAPGNAAIRNESDGTRSQSVTPQVAPGNAAIRNESDGTRSQSVPPQVAPGQRTYKTQISGGTVAIGDHSVVNVDTRSQSVTPQVPPGNATIGNESVGIRSQSGSRQGAAEIELWSDFVKAIQEGNEAGVRQILKSKATCNGTGNGSSFLTRKIKKPQGALTALHLAVMKGEEKIVRLLIEKGSDVNAVDEHKRSPLHVAVEQENSIPIIQLLLNHKDININAIDAFKHTPIQLAAEKGNFEAVSALLKKGADITKEDIVQNTAIHVAAEKGNFKVLTVILPEADLGLICKLNKHRNTPLHLAVRRKCLKTVAVLLRYGADGSLEIKNEHGETPKDLASREREILELLQGNNSEKLKEVSQSGVGDSYKKFASSGEGPVIPENLQIQDMSSQQRTDLTVALTGVLTTKTKNKAPLWTKKISVSSVITSEGGTVVGEGVKLVCAPGVVERPVTVTVTLEDPSKYCGLLVQNDLENDIMFCAPIINLQPNGHHFKRGVELTVRLKGAISSFNEVVILHGKETCLRKIAWEDITQNTIESNETSDEVIITTERFSIIAAFMKRTLILTKDIASRLNLLRYNYSLLVLFNDKSVPNQLAVVFVSEDVENEAFFQEDKTSVLVQLKEEGFREIFLKGQDDRRICNHEELKVSTSLGEDFKCSSSDLTVVVESSTWWSTGHAIKLPLESTKQDKILCGRITVKGEYGNSKEMTFCDLDIHGYVRDLLGVKGDIFNVIPIAEALKLSKEALHEIKEKWRDDECQLEVILEKSDVSSLKEVLEGLKPDYRLTTERGQMHVKHLRYLATKIGSLEHDSVELEKYFAIKIHAYCQMVLRDCCLEMESTAYGVGKAASSTKLDAFITIRMLGSIPDCLKDFLFFACKDICSSSEECIIEKFKSVVPELIQMIKEVFVENDTNHEEQNGLRGLSDETLAPFELSIRIARQDKTVLKLMSVVSKILEKLCQQNCSYGRKSEIERWGKSAANLAMLDFLKSFFQNCPENRRLHKRLELFSERMVDILSNPREFADEVFIRNFANIALSLIDFAKFDASKLVRFVLIDSSNSCINCSREHTQYDLNRNPSVFSQTIHVKKESEDELKLHASASVHMGGEIHEVGSFQLVIMLCESGWESLEKCRRKMPRVTTAKMKDKDSDNLRVVLCSSQKQELSEVLQVLGSEMSEGLVDLTKSQVTQCPLTARSISAKAGKVLSLRLIYKWGSGSLDLESKDFVVCANSSARSASFPELPLFGFSTAAQRNEAAATQGNPFPIASADVNLNFPISQPFSQRPLNIQCRKVESEERAIVLPCELVESLSCQSSDCKQVVSQFKENLLCSEASLDNPDVETKALIRRFTREAKCFDRLDVVQHLREITPAGTTGPVLPENLQIQDMSSQQRTDLTVALTVADGWQLVAEKFGLNRDRIDYLNLRYKNPADALLAHVARQRPLTVGFVYDLLCKCELPVIADKL
ncbi:uncharacterized protein [Montipora capricornis]|uniref:uncharacterized protein isoform X3 n=1 Tax=Montipora capricornis TaxID=246305 RepID=UPI0035F11FA4